MVVGHFGFLLEDKIDGVKVDVMRDVELVDEGEGALEMRCFVEVDVENAGAVFEEVMGKCAAAKETGPFAVALLEKSSAEMV